MTKLETIRKLIEDKVAAEMTAVLMERAINYHCRQGLRKWCDCSFCREKRIASFNISHGYAYPKKPRRQDLRKWCDCSFCREKRSDEYETWKQLVNKAREVKRKEVRNKLEQLKKEL